MRRGWGCWGCLVFLWLGEALVSAPPVRAEEPAAVTPVPVLDFTGKLTPKSIDTLGARLRAGLVKVPEVRWVEPGEGPAQPAAKPTWTVNQNRFPLIQKAGVDYALQVMLEHRENDCLLSLLAFYLPTWDRIRVAHSAVKAITCGNTVPLEELDELVARLRPALLSPPDKAVALSDRGPPVVAVFMMEDHRAELSDVSLADLTGRLIASLAESGRVRVLTRNEIRARILDLSPRKGEQKECFERECFIRLSHEIDADVVVFSNIHKVGTRCFLLVQVFDVPQAASLTSSNNRCACNQEALLEVVKLQAPLLEQEILRSLSLKK